MVFGIGRDRVVARRWGQRMVKRVVGSAAVLVAALGLALGSVGLLLEEDEVRGLVAAVPGLEGHADAVVDARNDLAGSLAATADEISFDVAKTVRGLLGQRPARPRVLIELPPEQRTPARPDKVETADLPPPGAEPPPASEAAPTGGEPGPTMPEAPAAPDAAASPDMQTNAGPPTEMGALPQAYEAPPPPPMPTDGAGMAPPTQMPAEPPMPPSPPEAADPAPQPATPPAQQAAIPEPAPQAPESATTPKADETRPPAEPPALGMEATPAAARTGVVPGQPGAAEHRLAVRYYTGDGVMQDYAKAADLFRRAAMQGHAAAQYNLGILNYFGQGTAPDIKEAAHWFQRAADQDFADAQYNLGFLYFEGLGVAKNLEKAWLWFSRAAKHGHAEASKVRDQLKAELPPEITRQ